MQSSNQKTWLIDNRYLHCNLADRGKWCKKSLPLAKQQTEFLSAHICQDINCTISTCIFEQDYQSCIQYPEPTTLLVFGMEGISEFTFQSTGGACIVRPGDIWLISIGEEALLRTTPANVLSKMTVIKYATARLQSAFNQSEEQMANIRSESMVRLGLQQSPDDWIEALIKNKLCSVSDRLMAEAKALELIARLLNPLVQDSSSSKHPLLQTVIDLLKKNLADPPNLYQLAKQVDMSHTSLNRCFKNEHGMTAFSWLRQYRLSLAKKYLADPGLAITNIALNCGFSSASHFTQSFKAEYGITPSEYRSQV